MSCGGGNFGYTGANLYLGYGGFVEKWHDWPTATDAFSGRSWVFGANGKWHDFVLGVEVTARSNAGYSKALREAHEQQGHNVLYSNMYASVWHLRLGRRF
jgi:hypothetical protein